MRLEGYNLKKTRLDRDDEAQRDHTRESDEHIVGDISGSPVRIG